MTNQNELVLLCDSGESDYTIGSSQLIFVVGSNLRECTAISATDDSVLETAKG